MPAPCYEFGRFRVDATERTLLHDGEDVQLTQKAFDVLLALVERGGHVVGKEELMRGVWPGQFVDEGNLTQNVYTLRKALEGREGGRQYIETAPRRGYRFKPRVETKHDGARAADERTEHGRADTAAPQEHARAPLPQPPNALRAQRRGEHRLRGARRAGLRGPAGALASA